MKQVSIQTKQIVDVIANEAAHEIRPIEREAMEFILSPWLTSWTDRSVRIGIFFGKAFHVEQLGASAAYLYKDAFVIEKSSEHISIYRQTVGKVLGEQIYGVTLQTIDDNGCLREILVPDLDYVFGFTEVPAKA